MSFVSKKSCDIDHSVQDVIKAESDKNKICQILNDSESHRDEGADAGAGAIIHVESGEERKARMRSHFVIYAMMFVLVTGYCASLSGVWPYLQQLEEGNEDLSKTALGWVSASTPFGQMIAAPVVGMISNKLGKVRMICYFTVSCSIFGNLLYSFLPAFTELWNHSAFHLMILARFIIGISMTAGTLGRTYLVSSTTMAERTTGIALNAAAGSMGFIVGPIIQITLSLTVPEDYKYRSTGWVGATIGCINLILLTPYVFQEFNIAEMEKKSQHVNDGEKKTKQIKAPAVDYIAVFSILVAFFINCLTSVLLETLMEPFLTDQYEWCNDIAVVVIGVFFMIAGILTVCLYIIATKVAKIYDERKLLIFGSVIPIAIGLFLFQPWGPNKLNYCANNSTTSSIITTYNSISSSVPQHYRSEIFLSNNAKNVYNEKMIYHVFKNSSMYEDESKTEDMRREEKKVWCDGDECLGCSSDQTWCIDYPALPLSQCFIALTIVVLGFPFGRSMCYSIYSKLLGPRPQGTWMGIIGATSSFSRVIGPLLITYVYSNFGTRWCFGILFCTIMISFIQLVTFYPRLVPLKVSINDAK